MVNVRQIIKDTASWFRTAGEILITPAAVLPLAGLLIMAGDLLSRTGLGLAAVLSNAGTVMIAQFPLFVAICLAYGLADGRPAAAALAGALSHLVFMQAGSAVFNLILGEAAIPSFNMGLLSGVLAGVIAALMHKYFRNLKLPEWLKFFSGCRLSAILAIAASLIAGALMGAIWTAIQTVLTEAAARMTLSRAGGAFAYGFLNRLLLPLGLHQVLNQEIWFRFGEFTSQTGQYITGDLNRFLAGDPTAGRLIAGFYPMMIFGVPAIALCFALTARLRNRTRLILLMAVNGVVSLVSGVTEPMEFLILFVSPLLYVLYAVLYGLSMLICYQLQVLLGFQFSTGLTDYLANWNRGTWPERIWQVGIVIAVLAFAVTYFSVTLLKLRAPGHDRPEAADLPEIVQPTEQAAEEKPAESV
ncbi:MAG TPA: hypothetical protein DCM45_06555 [Clostridiales bacterium]|nr:hypothetical protein [Clostridiales bacterium]